MDTGACEAPAGGTRSPRIKVRRPPTSGARTFSVLWTTAGSPSRVRAVQAVRAVWGVSQKATSWRMPSRKRRSARAGSGAASSSIRP